MTGAAHLFGGERALLRLVVRDVRAVFQEEARVALAPTPRSARALARFKPGAFVTAKDMPHALYQLPVGALELSLAQEEVLLALGIETVLGVLQMPRAQVLMRLGAAVLEQIDALLGHKHDPRAYVPEPKRWQCESHLMETLYSSESLCLALEVLLGQLCAELAQASVGMRRLRVVLTGIDRKQSVVVVGVSNASCDAQKLMRLLDLKLQHLDVGMGIDHVAMRALGCEVLRSQAQSFFTAKTQEVSDLWDVLNSRLSAKQLFQFDLKESHIPEKAFTKAPWNSKTTHPSKVLKRPIRLIDPPMPLRAMAMLPDSPPRRLFWERGHLDIVKADGPERIEGEWWQKQVESTRDYYCIEDAHGRRYWVYKETDSASWFLHGLFA